MYLSIYSFTYYFLYIFFATINNRLLLLLLPVLGSGGWIKETETVTELDNI